MHLISIGRDADLDAMVNKLVRLSLAPSIMIKPLKGYRG